MLPPPSSCPSSQKWEEWPRILLGRGTLPDLLVSGTSSFFVLCISSLASIDQDSRADHPGKKSVEHPNWFHIAKN